MQRELGGDTSEPLPPNLPLNKQIEIFIPSDFRALSRVQGLENEK